MTVEVVGGPAWFSKGLDWKCILVGGPSAHLDEHPCCSAEHCICLSLKPHAAPAAAA